MNRNDRVRQRIISTMLNTWYWNAIFVLWFLTSPIFIVASLAGYGRVAIIAAIVWAATQILIRIGIIRYWGETWAIEGSVK